MKASLQQQPMYCSRDHNYPTKCLFLFFCFVLSCIFCCFGVYIWGYKSNVLGVLIDLPDWHHALLASLVSLARVGQALGLMSSSSELSGQFTNLAALPIGLGFNSQSSEGC